MNDLFSYDFEINDLDIATTLLKESRADFLKLFNFSPACMSLTTPERVFVKVNEKFPEKFGYTENEIVGGAVYTVSSVNI